MSIRLTQLVQRMKMPSAQKAVLLQLAWHSTTRGAWPSVTTLATTTCLHRRTVERALHWLEAARLIVVTRRHGTCNRYTLTLNGDLFNAAPLPATSGTTPLAAPCRMRRPAVALAAQRRPIVIKDIKTTRTQARAPEGQKPGNKFPRANSPSAKRNPRHLSHVAAALDLLRGKEDTP